MSPFRLWVYKCLICWLPESSGFSLKAALLRWAGARVGRNVRLYSTVSVLGNGALEIGDDVHIGSGVKIFANHPATVVIGDHVDIGPDVMLVTGSHMVDIAGEHIGGAGFSKDISIGHGSWLAARATILPGVHIPPKTLVAAGTVVIESPDVSQDDAILLAGIPAVVKKRFNND